MALLPDTSTEVAGGITVATTGTASMSNKTYRMRIEEDRVRGTITGDIEAVRQAVYKILNTERYKHISENQFLMCFRKSRDASGRP